MKKKGTYTILFLLSLTSFSQNLVKGIVRDSENHKIISYVNIGFSKKNIGTTSNEKGRFKLEIPSDLENDTITFSSIGYKSKSMPAKILLTNLKLNPIIELLPEIIELKEVVITNKVLKEKIIGNKSKSKAKRFSNAQIGEEIGIKIEIKSSPTYIKKFHTNIVLNEGQGMKFRMNFYNIKNELPNKKIVRKNIIFKIDVKEGEFTLNLEKYNIIIEEDFYCTIELIEKPKKDSKIYFSSSFFGDNIFRPASQGEWYKANRVAIGLNYTVEY